MVLVILTGSIFGNIIGNAFSNFLPILNFGETIGFGPVDIDLNIINITLGFNASLTVSGIIGIIIAIIAYKKIK